MDLERRSKYPGVKIHLEGHECQAYLDWLEQAKLHLKGKGDIKLFETLEELVMMTYTRQIARLIKKAAKKDPNLLMPRTAEQVKAQLEKEQTKAAEKLARMAGGETWNA